MPFSTSSKKTNKRVPFSGLTKQRRQSAADLFCCEEAEISGEFRRQARRQSGKIQEASINSAKESMTRRTSRTSRDSGTRNSLVSSISSKLRRHRLSNSKSSAPDTTSSSSSTNVNQAVYVVRCRHNTRGLCYVCDVDRSWY